MKHHSNQELDEKIHAFLTSKTAQLPDWQVGTPTDTADDRADGMSNFFSPFIALQPLHDK